MSNQNQLAKEGTPAYLSATLNKEDFKKSLLQVIPKHLTPERVIKMALVAASRSPKLFKCTTQSFLQAVMKAGELGLECSGTLGQAYLVPFFNGKTKQMECQFIAGYQGLVELVHRSERVDFVDAQVVHENDIFDYALGSNPHIDHKPQLGKDRGKLKAVYAVAQIKGASKPKIEIMALDQIDAIRARSKAGKSGPWCTDYGEMARKTVLRRLCKYLPKSPDLASALEADQELDMTALNNLASSMEAGVNGLKERIKKQVESEEVETPEPTTAEDGGNAPEWDGEGEETAEDPTGGEAEPEPEKEKPVRKWGCECGHAFNKPTREGLCPKCLGKKITETKTETAAA